MRRFISPLIIFIFTVWILPLGIFVKPWQEQSFCNGRRAICLCSKMMTQKAKNDGGVTLKQSAQGFAREEAKVSSHSYLFITLSHDMVLSFGQFWSEILNFPFQLFIKSIDPVPKD